MTAITKSDLTERKRGKGGSIVIVAQERLDGYNRAAGTAFANPLIVKDLMQRKGYDRATRIGVGPADGNLAFGIDLADIESVVCDQGVGCDCSAPHGHDAHGIPDDALDCHPPTR